MKTREVLLGTLASPSLLAFGPIGMWVMFALWAVFVGWFLRLIWQILDD